MRSAEPRTANPRGTDRILLVGVAIEDATTTDANITSVTINGTALLPVPNSKRSGGDTGVMQTQLFTC
jgi:hypothetical protein